jgi:hypothetical protein
VRDGRQVATLPATRGSPGHAPILSGLIEQIAARWPSAASNIDACPVCPAGSGGGTVNASPLGLWSPRRCRITLR